MQTPIQYLKGVGPARKKIFERVGILSIGDLIYYLPRRYEDRTHFSTIKELEEGVVTTVKAQIIKKSLRRLFRRRMSIFQAAAKDDSGIIKCIWFNQPFLNDYLNAGDWVILHGKVEKYKEALQFGNPEIEIISEEDDSLNIGRVVPVYPLTEKLTQRQVRKSVDLALTDALPKLKDCLSHELRKKYNLENLAQALHSIHFPESIESIPESYRRLTFDEFLQFQLIVGLKKNRHKQQSGLEHITQGDLGNKFLKQLPFEFTMSQQIVSAEIMKDLSSNKAMRRLLQVDVGSGKTVVATYAAVVALQNNKQCAFMAPTEILAQQHYNNIKNWFKPLKARIALLTSSTSKDEKEKVYKLIAKNEPVLVIGTHSLIQDEARFKNLSLIIIDEQHKFGVLQQRSLVNKGQNPDLLVMTATPIPRSLALTLYGDLDISTIEEMPKGRGKIKTTWAKEAQRKKVYSFLKQRIDEGRQVFIVYPLIEESDKIDLKAAIQMYEQLSKKVFKDCKVGLVHGKMKTDEIKKVMSDFKKGKTSVLVSTIIIEVGIDIPNATCLLIEHAERFGLSQLHQMRGRIGRGSHESYCILFSDKQSEIGRKRIEALCKTTDGFKISEADLKLRGPGEFFGQRQHGDWDFRIGNPIRDIELLKLARDEAFSLLDEDQTLAKADNQPLKEALSDRFPQLIKKLI